MKNLRGVVTNNCVVLDNSIDECAMFYVKKSSVKLSASHSITFR